MSSPIPEQLEADWQATHSVLEDVREVRIGMQIIQHCREHVLPDANMASATSATSETLGKAETTLNDELTWLQECSDALPTLPGLSRTRKLTEEINSFALWGFDTFPDQPKMHEGFDHLVETQYKDHRTATDLRDLALDGVIDAEEVISRAKLHLLRANARLHLGSLCEPEYDPSNYFDMDKVHQVIEECLSLLSLMPFDATGIDRTTGKRLEESS